MKSLVIGSGAVGLGVGSCLLEADRDVVFVTRPGRCADLRAHGLHRTGIFGEAHLLPARFEAVDTVDAVRDEAFDFVLVCTKTFASREVAASIAKAGLRGNPAIVLMHNGWGSADVFASALPHARERIFNARVITGFLRSAPNAVEITVHAEPIRLGSLFGAAQLPLEPLAEAIRSGGVPCEVSHSIERDLWAKMLYSCALNPLGALRGLPYGELAADPSNRSIMAEVVGEIFEVAAAARIALDWTEAPEYLRFLYDVLLPPTARHESSMLQDLRAGRPTEIDALCGAVASLGDRHDVATPVNAALRDLVLAAQAKRAVSRRRAKSTG